MFQPSIFALLTMSSQLHAFPPLPEWQMAATRGVGPRPPQLPYARVYVPDAAAPIDLLAGIVMARIRIHRPL